MLTHARYGALVLFVIVLVALLSHSPARAQDSPKFTGAASCGASNCHGSTTPRAEYPKLNENIVWVQK